VSRFSLAAFAALVLATIAAFFVTQHLKVTTPLIAGAPAPYPAAINPVDGSVCNGLDHRYTTVSFYLLHRSDDVDVYVIDQNGSIVRTLASGRHMRRGVRKPDGVFVWDGREDDGRLAPQGNYYFRVALIHQGRTVEIANGEGKPEPISVITTPPRPVVTGVVPALIPQRGSTAVTIRYQGNEDRGGMVQLYRTDLPGGAYKVKSFATMWRGKQAIWDGYIDQRPAAQGVYLAGFEVTDNACNTGSFPSRLPPAPGSTPHAGITVRYLAAEPPLDPVRAGTPTTVYVDSRTQRYRWSLQRVGAHAASASGLGSRDELRLTTPGSGPGLYLLAVQSGSHQTAVPLVLSGRKPARMLVVLPSLTWQGQNPVDEDGDGVPDTLDAGGPIELARPLMDGLPPGLADEAGLLAYLDRSHLPYDLTTDQGLIDGVGPALTPHAGVVLAGSERWLPSSLSHALRAYVEQGGHVLSLGIDSLRRTVTEAAGEARDPTAAQATDALAARPGALITGNHDLVSVISDGLGIFAGTSGALLGYSSYQPFLSVASPAQLVSQAGTGNGPPSIVGYRLAQGIVVDIGLSGFGSSLPSNVNAQELIGHLWSVLGA